MDKALQTAFLDALREWFEAKERILCKGDLIVISLDEEAARLRPRDDEDTTTKAAPSTTVAYFKVTSLQEESGDSGKIHPAYYGHGRKVVPSQTKMVQTGVEHSRTPIGSVSQYYALANRLPLYRTETAAFKQLHELVSSSLHPLGREFKLSCNALIQGPRGGGKSTLIREVAEELGVHVFEFSAYDVVSETDAKTEVHLRAKFEKAAALSPCIVLLRNIEGLARKSQVVESGQEPLLATVLQECIESVNETHTTTGYPIMVMSTTSDVDALPTSILGCFRHEVVIEAPDEKSRLQILRNLTVDSPIAPDVSLSSLATQTAALVSKDLVDLLGRAGVLALQRINGAIDKANGDSEGKAIISPSDIYAAGILLTAADFDAALNEARASYSDSIGAPKIPSVTWDDVGGMAHVKDDILDTIQLPLEHPELFGSGLKKRSGILLYGPPGTGKTLLAKAIATSCSLNFFSVKGPELLNMYIGESEANVRRVFQRARDAKPCVVFFDELDSVAPKRGEKGDSGGVMDRIVSQLLAELDGMSEGGEGSGVGDVFVIGATNRPDLLDPALLRPGRFDKLLYLGVSQDHESQLRIIQALTRKFRLHPDLDLARVAERCPFHYTGADFYALCSDAMLKAMTRVAETIEVRVAKLNEQKRPDLPQTVTAQYYLSRLATPDEILVQVEEIDFVNALNELVPSVSATELAHYSKVREKFEQKKDEEPEEESKVLAEQEAPRPQMGPTSVSAAELAPSEPKSNVNSTKKPRKDKGKGKARAQ
ncbi:P-loop containing nucleoside triphosphate hydrolase protein [Syncephalastrum racemosum]|uniref:Peroxisomal ATPase PEX6 n=1 Tax=Syncephalastrum racemosum TaxID=13706 RepID=A0A1X2GYY7_SYNRA|nr:P-loop containing nucleoside triphosphate hydrolase protein [Syncephalastrum racemosum]